MKPAHWIGGGLLAMIALTAVAGYVVWRAGPARHEAERLILGTLPLPKQPGREESFGVRGYIPSSRELFQSAVYCLKQQEYAAAAAYWRSALHTVLSTDRALWRRGAEERALLRVARDVTRMLPPRHVPLQVCRFSVPGTSEQRVVLSARLDDRVEQYQRPQLSLVRREREDYQRISQSDVLRDPSDPPPHFVEIALYVTDLTGDGVPEAAVLKAALWDHPDDDDLRRHLAIVREIRRLDADRQ